jgi:hypothetical protein
MRSAIWDGGNYNNPSNVLITAEIPRVPSVINVYQLVGGTARTITLPTNPSAEFAFFNSSNTTGTANATYYICDASIATATIPTGDIINGHGAEFMPNQRNIRNITQLSVIAPTNSFLYVTYYARADNVSAT